MPPVIYGITVVHNEQDIVEDCLLHHLAEGCDRLLVIDHRSSDDTPQILARLAETHPIEVQRDDKPGHNQDVRMTRLAQQAYTEGADWVLPFDADEFFYSDQGTVADILAQCPPQMGVLNCRGFDHITRDDKPFSPYRRTYFQPLPKVAFRAADGVKVAMGNHAVAHPLPAGEGPINYRHFQYRSFDQLRTKVREGTKATDAAGHDKDTDFHWRELAALSDVELQARWLITCSESGLVFDPAPIRRPYRVAVIVPTLDPESRMVTDCLEAVRAGFSGEIIVEHDIHRAGFAETCNSAALRTTADVLVFLNDDTIAHPGWLEALTRRVGWGIVGGLLVYPHGGVQHSGVFFDLGQHRAGVLEPKNRLELAESGEVPAVTGACLAVRRDVWDRLGGFDEEYVNGYEDIDLCLRHRCAGGRVFLAADCVVTHLESRSPGRFDHAQHNIALLQERWGDLEV